MQEATQKRHQFLRDIFDFAKKYWLHHEERIDLIEKDQYLDVVIKDPLSKSELTITSENDEISIFFHYYHTHLDVISGDEIDSEGVKDFMKKVSDILASESVAVGIFKGDKLVRSEMFDYDFGKYEDKILEEMLDSEQIKVKIWGEEEKVIDISKS